MSNPALRLQYKRTIAKYQELGVPTSEIVQVINALKDDPDCGPYLLEVELTRLLHIQIDEAPTEVPAT